MDHWYHVLKGVTGDKDVLQHYTLKQKIGSGAYGSVYLALSKSTKETVAIKKISKEDKDEAQLES